MIGQQEMSWDTWSVEVAGWSFNAVILVKNNVVIYTLTDGQPAISEFEENENPLGPLQGSGESMMRGQLPLP